MDKQELLEKARELEKAIEETFDELREKADEATEAASSAESESEEVKAELEEERERKVLDKAEGEWLSALLEACEAELNGTGRTVAATLRDGHKTKHLLVIQDIRRALGL